MEEVIREEKRLYEKRDNDSDCTSNELLRPQQGNEDQTTADQRQEIARLVSRVEPSVYFSRRLHGQRPLTGLSAVQGNVNKLQRSFNSVAKFEFWES